MSNHVPFFIVYGNVFEKDVSEHAKLIYLYLSSCVNRVTGACYPSYKTIGEQCSIKSQTTISNALKELIAVGVLEVIHQSYKTKRSNNQYLLLEHPRNQKSKNEVSFAGPLKEKPAPSGLKNYG